MNYFTFIVQSISKELQYPILPNTISFIIPSNPLNLHFIYLA